MDSFRRTLARGGLAAVLAIGGIAAAGTASASPGSGREAGRPGRPPRGLRGHGDVPDLPRGLRGRDHEGRRTRTPSGRARRCRRRAARPATLTRRRRSGARPATARARSTRRPAGTRRRSARFKSLSAKDASDTCVSCHFRTNHTFWAGSQHDERAVGCTSCHSIHAPAGDKPAQGGDADRPVRAVPPDDRQQAVQVQPHAGARGQDGVLVLPQRARLAEREAAEGRRHGQRVLRLLPRREARAAPVGAPAGDRELLHLPRPARLEQRPDADRQAAVPVPALPRDVAAPSHRLRGLPAEQLARTPTRSTADPAWSATSRFTGRTAPTGKAFLR